MNAVGADQDIAAHGLGVTACAIEEIGGYAAFVLGEGPQPAAGMNRILSQPLLDGTMDHALQPAAMNRELRHVMTGVDAAAFAPDFLAMAIEVVEHVGTNGDGGELLQQAEAGEFADRMRQGVDADAKLADGVRLLKQFAANATGPQHQRRGEAADAASDDNGLHRPNSTLSSNATKRPPASHGRLLRCKRLCCLRLQLGPGLWLSLNFQIVEILSVADAVAENLLLAGQILRRAGNLRTVPGRGFQRERRIDQMRAAERHEVGAARGATG